MEDMIIDTESFDIFSQLDDLVVAEPAPARKAAKPEPVEEVEEVDAEEVEEDSEFSFEDLSEEDEEAEEEADEEEVEEEAEEEEVEETDDDEVDYEGYEVTLPNGETVKLNEAISGYKNAEEIKAEKEAFETARAEFEEKSKDLSSFLSLAKLEAEKVVEDYKDFDWAAMSKDDPTAYVEHREFLDKYKARLKEIKSAATKLEDEKAHQESETLKEQARECVQVLQRDIPGWGKELYSNLMGFAVENGMPEEVISGTVDPSVFKLLHKAYQFDKGKAVAKAKITRMGTPKKVVKAAPKATISKPSKKAAIEKKLSTGKFSDGDLSDAFNFLED